MRSFCCPLNLQRVIPEYRILFIGVRPILKPPDLSELSNEQKMMKSNFKAISDFIKVYNKCIYRFLYYEPALMDNELANTVDFDFQYAKYVINWNLSEGLPQNIGIYDIVYIDNNVLKYVDSSKTDKQWIDFFAPLVSGEGCIITDDTFAFNIKTGIFGTLGNEVYNGFTKRFNTTGTFDENKFFDDFMKMCVRMPKFANILFRMDGANTSRLTGRIMKWKQSWVLH